MDTCKKCGAPISWRRTDNGKSMPINSDEIPFVPDSRAKFLALDPDGNFIRGRPCSESYEAEQYLYCRISHFSTCPHAENFRR